MKLSAKQGAVLMALQERGTLTLKEAVELVGQDIYDNQANHVGGILSRMVKRGLIVRVKPGVFEKAKAAPTMVRPKGWWED